ncbi:MAG: UDP-N-acetylmuramate dehydrogenase [Candidatus Omnitrophota bacterium]
MLDSNILDKIEKICRGHGGEIIFNYPLEKHSTIGIGGSAGVLYKPAGVEELKEVKFLLDNLRIVSVVIGRGSNVLIPDDGVDNFVINLSNASFREIVIEDDMVFAGSGVFLERLIADCCTRGLSGLEGLSGIPATVGGALRMNASHKTEISRHLVKVLVMDSKGKVEWKDKDELKFHYRGSSFNKNDIILQAVFGLGKDKADDIKKRMKEYFSEKVRNQPIGQKTLGCVFKNPKDCQYSAGELIDRLGLKGRKKGGAEISQRHANFIVNTGKAVSNDVRQLMAVMEKAVRENFSIKLESEIEIW